MHESPAKAKMGSQNFFSLFVSFFTVLQCCGLGSCCVSFFPVWLSGYIRIGMFLTACVQIGPLPSSSLCVLIGPGLPLPTDAAPPTTAQCIRPAAPRDCPRTSLSLFPRSSSPVRWGREEGVEDDLITTRSDWGYQEAGKWTYFCWSVGDWQPQSSNKAMLSTCTKL